MKTQSTTATDCRCKACGALLAKRDRDGLTIRRGDMQVVVSGDSTVEAPKGLFLLAATAAAR